MRVGPGGCDLDHFFDLRGDHGAGVLERGDGLVVASGHEVRPDARHVFEHLHTVAEIAHAAALVVAPGDRNLADNVLQLAGDEEYLGIEAPALDGLEAEDDLRGLAFEGLEAALRVFVGQAHDGAGDPVEATAEELAVEGLVDGLPGAVHPARTDGNVGAVGDGVEEALGFFHWGGEIGVGEHDDVAGGLQEAVTH